jgi:predicted protein tyrosine phosphatase
MWENYMETLNKDGTKPIVKVWSRAVFSKEDISQQFQFAVSIQEWDEYPEVLRPDYKGQRLNLYFFDTSKAKDWLLVDHETKGDIVLGRWVPDKVMREVDLPGSPTKEDIDELYNFSIKWVEEAKKDVFSARLVVHCLAGISRSSACAMMPLTLFYGDYQKASEHLFEHYPYVIPNALILKLIKNKLDLNPK